RRAWSVSQWSAAMFFSTLVIISDVKVAMVIGESKIWVLPGDVFSRSEPHPAPKCTRIWPTIPAASIMSAFTFQQGSVNLTFSIINFVGTRWLSRNFDFDIGRLLSISPGTLETRPRCADVARADRAAAQTFLGPAVTTSHTPRSHDRHR